MLAPISTSLEITRSIKYIACFKDETYSHDFFDQTFANPQFSGFTAGEVLIDFATVSGGQRARQFVIKENQNGFKVFYYVVNQGEISNTGTTSTTATPKIYVVTTETNPPTVLASPTVGGARDFIMDLIIVDNILVGVRNNEAAAPLVDTLISARINSDGTLSAFNTFYLPLTRSFSFYWAGLKRHPTAPVVYVCGTSIQKNATIIQAVAISTSGVASIPASPLSSSITIPGMQFLPSRPNYINQKMYFFNGVIQIYQNHAQNGTTLSDNFLVTILVNDNNPFLMSLIARTPANFGGPHTQFLATPNGCLITMDDSTSAVFLLGAKKCAKQLIAEEKLSTPLCTAVQCAENPNRVNQFSVGPSSYCPPCNPYVVHADMDALSTGSTCRELSRPAGLHIPFATATVNASMALFQKSGATNDFAGLAGAGQFRLFNGCPNKYGCEFWVTGNNNTRRFVLSQDSFLLNAGTGAIAPATPIESNATLNTVDFVDMHCYRDIMYGLSNNVTVGAFYTNILGGVIGFNLNTVSGIATSSPFTVFAIYDHYVYAAINTRVVAFELYTGTLINLSSIYLFSLNQ